jgi:hypothetical protein
MPRHSFRSKNLEELEDLLSSKGYHVEKKEYKEELDVLGENVSCFIYPTKAYVLLFRNAPTERDKYLINLIKSEYKLPFDRVMTSLLVVGTSLAALALYLTLI